MGQTPHFEMHECRRGAMCQIARVTRDSDSREQLQDAVYEVGDYILETVEPRNKDTYDILRDFFTSFRSAEKIVFDRSSRSMHIRDATEIPDDHDGEILPSMCDGQVIGVISSERPGRDSPNEYPVYEIDGYRICSCGGQRYRLLGPHTIARIIERNTKLEPAMSPI